MVPISGAPAPQQLGENPRGGAGQSGSTFPVRQHFVPKLLLKGFCDDEGRLWMGRKKPEAVFWQRPGKAFVQNHIYTRHGYEGAPPSAEHEHALSRIESDAAPVIDRIVNSARCIEHTELSQSECVFLQRFILAVARRTPESQRRVCNPATDDDIYRICRDRADEVGYEGLPDQDVFFAGDGVREIVERILHNVHAGFAAGVGPLTAEAEEKFIAETGVRFAVIARPDKNFVIGSHGITICDLNLVGRYLAGTVLPLAQDVLVHVTPWPSNTGLLVLGGNQESSDLVDAINKATSTQSNTIAGPSETLIRSLRV
ncbi:MAG: DUF4238 domain-containing protein [Acidimicrobiia bacterium]|nr:DUF4238 domain-containing protein [Acidimicrobiia bacterium]MCY4435226.1 DUF4238 domain-containing protein [bacterium]